MVFEYVYPAIDLSAAPEDTQLISMAIIQVGGGVSNADFRRWIALTQVCQQLRAETRSRCFTGRRFRMYVKPKGEDVGLVDAKSTANIHHRGDSQCLIG